MEIVLLAPLQIYVFFSNSIPQVSRGQSFPNRGEFKGKSPPGYSYRVMYHQPVMYTPFQELFDDEVFVIDIFVPCTFLLLALYSSVTDLFYISQSTDKPHTRE